MVGDFRATLYDLFGYLVPGMTASVAVILVGEHFVGSVHLTNLAPFPTRLAAASLMLLAYVAGHAVHAIGNIVPGLNRTAESRAFEAGGLPVILLDKSRARLADLLKVDVEALPPEEMFALIDEARLQSGVVGDRDIYIYREGFYRGMVVALAMLAFGLVTHLVVADFCIRSSALVAGCIPRSAAFIASLAAAGTSWLFLYRMRRFGRYRVQRGLYQFLVLPVINAPARGQ